MLIRNVVCGNGQDLMKCYFSQVTDKVLGEEVEALRHRVIELEAELKGVRAKLATKQHTLQARRTASNLPMKEVRTENKLSSEIVFPSMF